MADDLVGNGGLFHARHKMCIRDSMEPMLGRGAPVAAWVGLLLGGMVIIGLLARLVQKILHIACAGWLDHLLGLGIGAVSYTHLDVYKRQQ